VPDLKNAPTMAAPTKTNVEQSGYISSAKPWLSKLLFSALDKELNSTINQEKGPDPMVST
jgi:hypothetical protein